MATAVAISGLAAPAQARVIGAPDTAAGSTNQGQPAVTTQGQGQPAGQDPNHVIVSSEFPGFQGYTQKQTLWCYAAVTQAMQRVFGEPVVSQEEIAHKAVYLLGDTFHKDDVLHLDEGRKGEYRAVQYFTDLAGYAEAVKLSEDRVIDPSKWSDVEKYVTESRSLYDTLKYTTATPDLDGRKMHIVATLTDEQIMKVIDDLGFIIVLRHDHYTLVYGYEYETSQQGNTPLRLKTWDPLPNVGEVTKTADEIRFELGNMTIVSVY
ncbi:MAG: hypothetical protein H0T78_02700 [Longispora sp.]|nr:hypothetical protein [Longispora sp. (in: high G+C Gram-positive bacteria)]